LPIQEVSLLTNSVRRRSVKHVLWLTLTFVLLAGSSGCSKMLVTKDPALKPIQEMLDQRLPPGTPRSNVSFYLAGQGYPEVPVQKPGTVVAIIRKIDINRMEPVTARVTFYFDANGKLTSFELQRTTNQPIP
jgi:hypothetical protein